MINWIKSKLGVTKLENDHKKLTACMSLHRQFVTDTVAELKEFTRVDADVGFRGVNTIILTGVYGGKAFVRFYDMGDNDFKALVEQIQHMRRYSLIRHIDKPPMFQGHFSI